jgi:hypothetical protein
MATSMRLARTGAVCVALGFAAGLLIASSPADAGLFTWLGGRNQNADSYQSEPAPTNQGIFGGRGGGGIFQPAQPRAPQSGAFHGDELPPEEGTEATRQWITNPAVGVPTLSTRNIEATKIAIQRYPNMVPQGGWPTMPAYAMHLVLPASRSRSCIAGLRPAAISSAKAFPTTTMRP